MPTTLDTATALVLIDLQHGITALPTAHPAEEIVDRCARHERGYELTIVTDAVTDTDGRAHLNSLRAIFPRIAELATTEEILAALAGTRSDPVLTDGRSRS